MGLDTMCKALCLWALLLVLVKVPELQEDGEGWSAVSGTPRSPLDLCLGEKTPQSTVMVWPIAPPRQPPLVPSWNCFYSTCLIAPDDYWRIPGSLVAQRYMMVYRRAEQTSDGREQLRSGCVFQAVRGVFSSGWRNAGLELGKSWWVAPSAGCWPGQAPHAAAQRKQGTNSTWRNAESGMAVPGQAGGSFGVSVGVFTSPGRAVPGGGGRSQSWWHFPGLCGHMGTHGWAGALLPGDGGQDRAWNLSLTLNLPFCLEPACSLAVPNS